jgi:hypothetical protein
LYEGIQEIIDDYCAKKNSQKGGQMILGKIACAIGKALGGCAQNQSISELEPTSAKEVDWSYINNILFAKFPSPSTHIYLSDKKYYLCSEDDIKRFLAQDQTNKLAYQAEIFDCDDFSYRLMGQLSYPKWSGIAFGILWTNLHALNCLIDENGKFWFVEPQEDKLQENLETWQGNEVLLVVM